MILKIHRSFSLGLCALAFLINGFHYALAADFYVSTIGNDTTGNGSKSSPWKTLRFASTNVPVNQGHTINLSVGTFVETRIAVPPGVNILGAGKDLTIIKADRSFHYYPESPGFGTDKFLINLVSTALIEGSQSIKNITIDGDGKRLHGGILVQHRNNVLIESVSVQYVNFCGIWLWDVNNSSLKGIQLKDCAWGSVGWCSGALQLANTFNVEVYGFNIDESRGYGIKNLAHTKNIPFSNVKIHDGRVSVNPTGLWNNGSAPNITIELLANSFPGTEIYNCYVDNHISLVNEPIVQRTTPIKIYNNIFDISGVRTRGNGYCIELSVHDADIHNNWFNGGITAIVNWANRQFSNWNIHHNTFYGISTGYPTSIVNAYKGGLRDINIFNNTVEMTGTATVNFIEFNHGGVGENIAIKNNLIMDSNTAYAFYPNRFINLEKGATIKNLQVSNNLLYKLPIGNVRGSYANNLTIDPKIGKKSPRPHPYYLPVAGSPLIDAGAKVGLPFKGIAPDIGAFEQ